jgi:hypothetical protein
MFFKLYSSQVYSIQTNYTLFIDPKYTKFFLYTFSRGHYSISPFGSPAPSLSPFSPYFFLLLLSSSLTTGRWNGSVSSVSWSGRAKGKVKNQDTGKKRKNGGSHVNTQERQERKKKTVVAASKKIECCGEQDRLRDFENKVR